MASGDGARLFGYRLRREQRDILAYRGGRMAVSAVPGSGKTLTLSLLAARLITEGLIGDEGEVLVVTLQNSAVTNVAQRIRAILQSQRLPPVGFRVCTLHKLAADVLRTRQDLAGVDETFFIVDEAESARLVSRAVGTWLATNRLWWESFLPEEDEGRRSRAEHGWREETARVAREVAKLCKHLRLRPEGALALLDGAAEPADGQNAFLRMGLDLYALYEGYLQVRGGLDFDDLIWRAIDALRHDVSFLDGLRARWPYILEDEAQDSSPLQEQILDALAGPGGNWVRVGDTNQSINSTFTAADPRYFRRFVDAPGVRRLDLPQSGRCGVPIMDLANRLVEWTLAEHREPEMREMAFRPQRIVPTEAGDAQRNPAAEDCWLSLRTRPFATPDAEAAYLADMGARYIRANAQGTCAILCPNHFMGARVVAALEAIRPPVAFDDLLRSTPQTRSVAASLAAVFRYLGQRTKGRPLADLLRALARDGRLGGASAGGSRGNDALRAAEVVLRSVPTERLLFPRDVVHLRDAIPAHVPVNDSDLRLLVAFCRLAAGWVRGVSLPPDQLLLGVAQDLFHDETDLAICHVLAMALRTLADTHPDWRLVQFAEELEAIARNRRAVGGLSLPDAGYVEQPGTVMVTTMHKSKGLEWDMVLLMGVDSLEFPDRSEGAFRDAPFFLAGRAPAVEARKRLEQLAGAEFACAEGESLIRASRLEYIAERLRLLYVGITRARRYLVATCSKTNSGRPVEPAAALRMLQSYYASRQSAPAAERGGP